MAVAMKYLSEDEAVEEGLRRALAGTPTREAAAEIYNLGIRPDEVATFVIRGLAASIAARLSLHAESWAEDEVVLGSEGRDGPQPTARGRLSAVPRNYAREHWEKVLSVANYEAADGQRKALLDFTATDAARLHSIAEARAAGYVKLAGGMRLALELLDRHKADVIAALPVKAKQAIAEAVA